MTIDGTNISAYGLQIIALPDYYSLPARKKVLTEPGFEAKDIVFEGREAVITLFGEYASLALMRSNIEALKTKIKSSLKHDYILVGHDESFSGVVTKGFKTEVLRNTVQIKLTISIVE